MKTLRKKTTIRVTSHNSDRHTTVTLATLKEMINERRKNAIFFTKRVRPTVITTDEENIQPAAHYTSFEIKQFSHHKAIEVYNAGGGQVAELV